MLFAKDKKGLLLFTTLFTSHLSPFFLRLYFAIFQSLKIAFDRFLHPSLSYNTGILRESLYICKNRLRTFD
jgi:hypothetical protein